MYRIWLSVFGAGFSQIVPGTCGSAVVSAVFLAAAVSGVNREVLAGIMLVVAVHGMVVTVAYGDRFIEQYGPDPSAIVSDEQCGQAITYLWPVVFAGGIKEMLAFTFTGFVLFRVFDIVKPPPVRQLEKIKGTWGVLLDDVMAGIYALIVLQIVWRFGWLSRFWS